MEESKDISKVCKSIQLKSECNELKLEQIGGFMRNVLVGIVIVFAVFVYSSAIYAEDGTESTPTQIEKTDISSSGLALIDVSDGYKYQNDIKKQDQLEKKKRQHEVISKKYASKKKVKKTEKKVVEDIWESLGDCRITCYCPCCNDPAGSYQSSSGTTLYEGCVACSWLPIGTVLKINGTEYTVTDTCGTDAIDIFKDTSYCCCDENYYTEVFIKYRKEIYNEKNYI